MLNINNPSAAKIQGNIPRRLILVVIFFGCMSSQRFGSSFASGDEASDLSVRSNGISRIM